MKTHDGLTSLAIACSLLFGPIGTTTAASAKANDSQDKSATPAQAVDDAWITTKVKAELATTSGVAATDVTVNTANGVVTLTGMLDSAATVKKAIAAARSVKGVKQVDASGLKSH